MSAVVQSATEAEENLTDGFNLIIDALKLNGLTTIYGVPGIPITDFGRMAQAAGIRVLSFRHEQNAGYAASIAGFLTKKPGVCLTVSAPGFLNGLTALAHATTNCFPMILISGSSEREIVDLQQGDYEEMDQLAIAKPLCKAAFRVLHAQDIGIGLARAIRAAVSGRPGGVYLDLPAKLFGQVMNADAGKKSLVKVIDAAPAQIPAPDAIKRALEVLKGAKKPLIILGKGAAYAQADLLAERGLELVYGGGNVGLMSVLADAVLERGGHVIGVIPKNLMDKELGHRGIQDLRVVDSMHARKALMMDLSDAFIALPGGFGTLEEFFEILSWSQLGLHTKPFGLLNTAGYYDHLIAFLDHAVAEQLLRPKHRALVTASADAADLLTRLAHSHIKPTEKWLSRRQT